MKKALSLLFAFVLLLGMMPQFTLPARAAEPEVNKWEGKKVSILSHSVSTYAGISNNTTVNSTIGDNDVYYTEGRYDVYQKDTWWQQVIDALGAELLVNNSWSGSCVFMPRKGAASVGHGDRAVNLHNDHTGEEPDVILVYLGCNDFAYYKDTFGKAADVDYTALIQDHGDGTFSYAVPQTTCEAYVIMLHKVQSRYPNAEVYCMTSTARRETDYTGDSYPDAGQPTAYSAQLQQIATHFGYPVIDLEMAIPKEVEVFDKYMGDKRAHPNALGMDQITNKVLSVMLGRDAEICHVTSEDGTVQEQAVLLGSSYCTEIELQEGYAVVVTMDGEDITAGVYSNGKICVDEVTGDIAIYTTIQRNPLNFRWEIQDDGLVSIGDTNNTLSKLAGTITNGVLDNTRYQLATSVVLKHHLPWALEWQCSEDWRGVVLSSDPAQKTAGMYYLCRTNGGQLCFGTWTGTQHNNYGVDLSYLDSQTHTYRLVNRIAADGSNMVWLCVDQVEIGPMNNYHIGSNSQSSTSDWLSGKDFIFSYIGTEGHALRNCQLDYLQIQECTHTYESIVTIPTCTEQGYTTHTCACGDSYRTPWLDKTAYEGKTIACVGDSITAAYGVTKDETDYVTLLAGQLGMDHIRLGDSGTTLCTDGSRTCNIRRLTEDNLQGADVVTIAMGINDFCNAAGSYYQLGDINSTDTSTIYGAARMWCERIAELRKTDSLSNTQFYFVTPVITSWNNSVNSAHDWDQSKTNIHGYTLRDLCNAMIEIAALYEVSVIDLNLLSGMYYVDAEDNNTAVFGGDGVHPGVKGHEMMASALVNALLQNDSRDDHTHIFGSWITTTWPSCAAGEQQRVCTICSAVESRMTEPNSTHTHIPAITEPTCTEQGYTTYTCECGDRYVDDYTDAAGHRYVNGVCTACGTAHANLANYEGKVISILGDSISTFAGYIPTADGFNLEHLARYPQDNLLTDVNETWWMQVISTVGAKLGINDSWRGATVSGAKPVTTGSTGENAAMGNLQRIRNLGANGTPDVILFYGGTNDLAHVSKVGTFDGANAPAEVDLTATKWDNLADGYVHTLLRLQYFYPDAQIVAMLPTYTNGYYSNEKLSEGNAVLAAICEHYGVTYVDLRGCGISTANLPDNIHPDATGMDYITVAVVEALLNEGEVEAGENVVHVITHKLTNAESSMGYYKGVTHGKSFEARITGEDVKVTVTMGGADITDTVYSNSVIAIAEVTGDIVISAEGRAKPVYEDHLQQLPEGICSGTNLWAVLEHDEQYYTANGWGIHSSGTVSSVTFPVSAGDCIYATSFGAAGKNGGNINGIRVTWFDTNGVLESMSADAVYAEFSANGYLSVPKGAAVVCVPMWKVSDDNELSILNREHSYTFAVTAPTCTEQGYTTYTCVCGDSYVDNYTDIRPLNILMIGNSFSWDAADFWYDMQTSMTYDAMRAMLADPYDVHLAVMYQGSATLCYHATCAANNTGTYTFQEIGPETNYTWRPSEGKNATNKILEHLQERDWDIIVIQSYQHEADGTEPRSTYTGGSAQFAEPSASLGFLLDYFAQNEPSAEVYYYMPWSSVKFYGTEGTTAGFEAIGEYTEAQIVHMTGDSSGKKISGIIPVGTAIENARTTYLHTLKYSAGTGATVLLKDPQIGLLYDTQHLSFGVGRYIAGLTVAQSLIPQEMQKVCVVWPSVKNSPMVGILPEEYSLIARKAVENAMQNPYAITPISGYDTDPADRVCDAITAADFTGSNLTDEASVRTHLEATIRNLLTSWGDTDFTLRIYDYSLKNGKLWNLDAEATLRIGYTTSTVQIFLAEGTIHRFGDWVHAKVPSAASLGLDQRVCAQCGYMQSVEVEGSWQKYNLADHLQKLPDSFCCQTNLWSLLEPESVMIDHLGNWVSAGAYVYSVTIPVKPGDRIYANSFGLTGSTRGIQVSFISDYGIVKTTFSSGTYQEFTNNGGYLVAPESAIAVNVPVWDYKSDNELYILNAEHSYTTTITAPTCTERGYTTHTCACGDSYVDTYVDALGHDYSAGLCTVCGEDTVSVSLEGSIFTLTGEFAEGTRMIVAGYDGDGRLIESRFFIWQGNPITEEVPNGETVELFLVDNHWSPLRQLIHLR